MKILRQLPEKRRILTASSESQQSQSSSAAARKTENTTKSSQHEQKENPKLKFGATFNDSSEFHLKKIIIIIIMNLFLNVLKKK